jgi:septum site-determining protein MinC
MVTLNLREGVDQPRPIQQLEAALHNWRLQQTLPPPGPLQLEAGSWLMPVAELEAMATAARRAGLVLSLVVSQEPRTRVAAAALGIAWQAGSSGTAGTANAPAQDSPLRIHQGTLRAGDHLDAEGSLLVLGDVNPGAHVKAAGHVLVWGTLRGVAHAGCNGDGSARIVALQLRPLQLRIAAAVARGPAEQPLAGMAEQAELIDGVIAINPALPQWPLAGLSG